MDNIRPMSQHDAVRTAGELVIHTARGDDQLAAHMLDAVEWFDSRRVINGLLVMIRLLIRDNDAAHVERLVVSWTAAITNNDPGNP